MSTTNTLEHRQQVAQELKTAHKKSAKPMLWIAMVSMTMMFAGLVSAYVISSKREDWVTFDLPQALITSTIVILLSSITFHLAQFTNKKNQKGITLSLLLATLILGVVFVNSQFEGFQQLKAAGIFFTGKGSLISSSMLMVIVFAHLLHIFAAIIVISVVIINYLRGKYENGNTLGLELGVIFWHFLDLLWIILFSFFYFAT